MTRAYAPPTTRRRYRTRRGGKTVVTDARNVNENALNVTRAFTRDREPVTPRSPQVSLAFYAVVSVGLRHWSPRRDTRVKRCWTPARTRARLKTVACPSVLGRAAPSRFGRGARHEARTSRPRAAWVRRTRQMCDVPARHRRKRTMRITARQKGRLSHEPTPEPRSVAARYGPGVLAAAVIVVALLGFGSLGFGSPGRVHGSSGDRSRRSVNAGAPTPSVTASAPADVFMQAIVTQNGQLAWQQLCPALQAKVSAPALANMANAQRTAGAGHGEQLGVDYVGTHAWAAGGEIRVYVVTTRGRSGPDSGTLYVLRTQASGCVDGILGG